MRRLRCLVLVLCLVGSLSRAATAGAARPAHDGPVAVTLIAFSDLHGDLEGPTGTIKIHGTKVPAGGIAYLASHIEKLEASHPHTILVAAGDLIGASPLISALFDDRPTIEALNLMGLQLSAVGNHELDHGLSHLLRLQRGCHPEEGCREKPFAGARFHYLAANLIRKDTGKTIFPPYEIRSIAGVKIAFIGIILKQARTLIASDQTRGLLFTDEVQAVNSIVPRLRKQGIEAIVLLIHQGGTPSRPVESPSSCGNVEGPIVGIVNQVDDAVDVVISGHTHEAYICSIDGKLLTSAKSFGSLVTDIDLKIDPGSDEVLQTRARNIIVDRDGSPDPKLAALVAHFHKLAAPLADQQVGTLTSDLLREPNSAGESALGDVIADAQLEATRSPKKGGAVICFTNPKGIRGDLRLADSARGKKAAVSLAELQAVQPFSNQLVTLTLTGAQIHELLEQQWQQGLGILQVSRGFSYRWDASRPRGRRVEAASIEISGEHLLPEKNYRVTVNSYLAGSGDGFSVLKEGTERLTGPLDLDALVAYFRSHSPISPGPQNRISRLH